MLTIERIDQGNPAADRVERRVVIAEVAGICFGVRRAIELTEAARAQRFGRLTMLGALVHNHQVVADMAAIGVESADRLHDITEGSVVVSAHGASPAVLAEAKGRGLSIVDVTCPFVTRVHQAALQLLRDGYQILLVGDPGHTEVKGIQGVVEEAGGSVTVISAPEQVIGLSLRRKVGLICQTTQRRDTFAEVVTAVCRNAPDVRALNTVCGATDELQEAALRMAREVEIAIVVGGRISANTSRLRALCEAQGIPAYQVETAGEVEESWLEGKSVIGITAGASTPDSVIEAVARRIHGGCLPEGWRLRHPD